MQILPSSFAILKEELFSNQRMFHTFPYCKGQWGPLALLCLELFFSPSNPLDPARIALEQRTGRCSNSPFCQKWGLSYNSYYTAGHAQHLLNLEIAPHIHFYAAVSLPAPNCDSALTLNPSKREAGMLTPSPALAHMVDMREIIS